MRRHPVSSAAVQAAVTPALQAAPAGDALVSAVQPLLEKVATVGRVEDYKVSKAWEMYDMPEVRFACRQYSNAFASAKLVLGKRVEVGRDPVPIDEPSTREEHKAYEFVQTFAGGPEGQVEFLDRMGTYFTVPGDMIAVGAYDPARMAENKLARWDLWSTSEIKWDGQRLHVRENPIDDIFDQQPDYIKHTRIWNRHPQFGWLSDSPVLSALGVLELIGLYDDRLAAEAISRLIGGGIQGIPQGLKLPSTTGDPAGGTPNDFLRLWMEVASLAIKDRRSAAAMLPILIEGDPEDLKAMAESHIDFSTKFDERLGELQEQAIKRWATGADFPAEVMLGLSQATHWNSSLISEDKVQSFVIPSLRRAVGSLTWGILRPAMQEFDLFDPSLVFWFDPSGIKTRVDLNEEADDAHEKFLITDEAKLYASGLDQAKRPDEEQLRRQMLMQMAVKKPETTPWVMQQLKLPVEGELPEFATKAAKGEPDAPAKAEGSPDGRQGPNPTNGNAPPAGPGRTARLSTRTT